MPNSMLYVSNHFSYLIGRMHHLSGIQIHSHSRIKFHSHTNLSVRVLKLQTSPIYAALKAQVHHNKLCSSIYLSILVPP